MNAENVHAENANAMIIISISAIVVPTIIRKMQPFNDFVVIIIILLILFLLPFILLFVFAIGKQEKNVIAYH